MNLVLEAGSESALRSLAERSGVTVERYVAEALRAHFGAYDRWFVAAVEKGLEDAAGGRVLSADESGHREQARHARLANRIG